ncbi:MAG: C-type lectin domain-containing protein [Myxococcota bacterium]
MATSVDTDPDQPYTYLCDRDQVAPIGRSSYCASTQRLTWDEGRRYCRRQGARMAQFETYEESEALRHFVEPIVDPGEVWLGLERSTTGWRWTDRPHHRMDDPSAWREGEPNNLHDNEPCATLDFMREGFNDLDCNQDRGIVCQLREPRSQCPTEPFRLGHHTYCVVPGSVDRHRARATCDAVGGSLPVLETPRERQALAHALKAPLNARAVWMGLRERAREGDWRWNSGQPFALEWDPGEPNDSGGEACGEWRILSGRFNDFGCHREIPVLCEFPDA